MDMGIGTRGIGMRRLYAVLLTCAMLLFGAGVPALADTGYDYLDAGGDLRQHPISDDHVIGGGWDTASTTLTGWYAVTGTVTVGHTLVVSGEAHLILTNGAALTVNDSGTSAGINVTPGNSLTVYAQSVSGNIGALTANGTDLAAGIGGGLNQSCGAVTINGGIVTANSIGIGGGNSTGAGIGGGYSGGGGSIAINGGVVTANGYYGAGIGGGFGGVGGSITINGGTVTSSSEWGAGIGGGFRGNGGEITICGGTVNSSGGWGASIGGGGSDMGIGAGHGVTITIIGGRVMAVGQYGAGIGGGAVDGWAADGNGGNITFRGGTIYASSMSGADIGGGYAHTLGGGGTVVIEGGSVNTADGIQASPTNGSANGNAPVFRTQAQLQGVSALTAVTSLTVTNASYYGTKDLYTDGSGKLHLYLPENAAATGAETEDRLYGGSIDWSESGTLRALGNDSALAGLALSHGALDPAFDSETTAYTATVPYGVEDVTVTATASDVQAALTVNGVAATSGVATGEIPLSVGENTIEVVCTAEDSIHETAYTVTVTRSGSPVISVQPTNRTLTEGQKATFTVEAAGFGSLSYQWYIDREGVKGWEAIDSPGARTATYTTSATKLTYSGYRYACRISNDAGSVQSEPATLTVIEKAAPQTGDNSNLKLWLMLMLLSGLALALLAGRRAFRRR